MKTFYLKSVLMLLVVSLSCILMAQNENKLLSNSDRNDRIDKILKLNNTNKKSQSFFNDNDKKIYGYVIYDYENPFERGPAYFTTETYDQPTLLRGEIGDLRCSAAGAYFDGYLYSYLFEYNDWGMIVPLSLSKIDLNTNDEFVVGDFSQLTFLFDDMTYDYTTDKMYYICSEGEVSKLGTVNLENGQLNHVIDIPLKIFTIACDMEGQLFAITSEGNLAKIDKNTGAITNIGATGIMPKQRQSMDFDHDNHILYWSSVNQLEQTSLCTIDLASGLATALGSGFGYNSQITSLYIPFTETLAQAPDIVENFNVISFENGGLGANISFKAPSVTLEGAPLNSILKIELFRNGTLIKEFIEPQPGEPLSFIDNVENADIYSYKVKAINEIGEGKPILKTMFIGEDTPAAPIELKLTQNGEKAVLQWKAPTIGLHEGWINTSSLSYTITRYPDLVTFTSATNSFIDETITKIECYSYKVQAQTSIGIGGYAISNQLIIGTPFNTPYKCDFVDKNQFMTWTVIDANSDGFTWKYDEMGKDAVYASNFTDISIPAEDWIISPDITFNVGEKYRIQFDVRNDGGDDYPEKLKIYSGQGITVQSQTSLLNSYTIKNMVFETKKVIFEPAVSGIYNIGFFACSNADMYMLHIDNIIIEKIYDNDLISTQITGNTFPIINNEYVYNVTVYNNGAQTQNNYAVQIIDEQSNILAETKVNQTIEPFQSKTIEVKFKPASEGRKYIFGKVILENDSNVENNLSDKLLIEIQPECNQQWITIGDNSEETIQLPFNFLYKTSVVQTIYTSEEIGNINGSIRSVNYSYRNNSFNKVNDKSVKLYIAKTNLTNLLGGWIPESEFTLVYEGNISIPTGESELQLMLDTPYLYDGGNICIMTVKEIDQELGYDRVNAMATIKEYGRSYTYYGDSPEFDYTQEGIFLVLVPKIKLLVTNSLYNINAKAFEGGKITPEGDVKIGQNKDITFKIQPDEKYIIKDVLIDDQSIGAVNEYTFKNVTSDHTILAIFEEDVRVENYNSNLNISLYPNPVLNYLNIIGRYTKIEIYDISNKLMIKTHGVDKIDVINFKNGIYIVKVFCDENYMTYKIVKK